MYIVFARETKCLIMEKQANNKTYAYMYAYFRKKALSFYLKYYLICPFLSFNLQDQCSTLEVTVIMRNNVYKAIISYSIKAGYKMYHANVV